MKTNLAYKKLKEGAFENHTHTKKFINGFILYDSDNADYNYSSYQHASLEEVELIILYCIILKLYYIILYYIICVYVYMR